MQQHIVLKNKELIRNIAQAKNKIPEPVSCHIWDSFQWKDEWNTVILSVLTLAANAHRKYLRFMEIYTSFILPPWPLCHLRWWGSASGWSVVSFQGQSQGSLNNQPAVQDELSCSVDHVHIPSRVSSEATIPLSTTVSSMKLRNHDLKLNLGALALGVGSHFQPSGVSSQRCAQCTSNPAVPYSPRMRHKRL